MLEVATKSTELVGKNMQTLDGVAKAMEGLTTEVRRSST